MVRQINHNPRKKEIASLIGGGIYLIALLVSSLLLLIEPAGFDIKITILPIATLLFIGSLGFSIGELKNSNKLLASTGAVALAILFTFIGFFIIAAVGWMIATSHT